MSAPTAPDPSPTIGEHLTHFTHQAGELFNRWFTPAAAVLLVLALIYWLAMKRTGGEHGKDLRKTAAQRGMAAKIGKIVGWETSKKCVRISKAKDRVEVRYPPTSNPTSAKITQVTEVVRSYLGGDWDAENNGLHNRLVVTRRPAPKALPEDVVYSFKSTDSVDMIPFGQDADGWVKADLTGLTPHVLVSASTGFGKTTILSVIIAHVAGHGGLVDICDPKRVGYRTTFGGLNNVRIYTEVDDMVRTVHRFYEDMEVAYRELEHGTRTPGTPLRMLVIDELGSFTEMVADAWRQDGEKGPPELFRIMKLILWRGRQAGFHVVTAPQQANAKALFNASDPRDQFALRIAIGPQSTEAWSMLFGRDQSRPNIQAHRGRAQVGIGTTFQTVQLAHLSPAKAREIAQLGRARFTPDHVGNTAPVVAVDHVDPPGNGGTVDLHKTEPTFSTPSLRLITNRGIDVEIPRAASSEEPGPSAPTALVEGTPPAPRPGRPGSVPAREMTCAHCGHTWSTTAKPGSSIKCPGCRKAKRLPVG